MIEGTTMTHRESELKLKDGSILSLGEWFKTRREPGQVFLFKGVVSVTSISGHTYEHIDAYGGAKNPEGHRAYRAFPLDIPIKKCNDTYGSIRDVIGE